MIINLLIFCIIDLPIIVSGNSLACCEPQEKMWRGESGQKFVLSDLITQSSDFVAPLNELAAFDSNSAKQEGYPFTIFRLPLRKVASGLSNNTYDIRKLTKLLDALREEAKYLLLFLKSVCKIEVIHISRDRPPFTSFCVEIAPDSLAMVSDKRKSFMDKLKLAHQAHPYQLPDTISFTANFSVIVTDNNSTENQTGKSEWLVANCVGSVVPAVQTAAAKQSTFPWVGAALELGSSPEGGRIFCFLPMPVETSSGLPIHVNGTFGLNDERRTLKWPGVERTNDPAANWNKILVSQLLPSCYAMLLTEAKSYISPEQFYKAWPDTEIIKSTQFSEILEPLFTTLFSQAVVYTEEIAATQKAGKWITITQATFISEGSSIPSILNKVLFSCGIQLVNIPSVVWQAIQFTGVCIKTMSPKLTRSQMRTFPESYSSINPPGKRDILMYCLLDNSYKDLKGLNLLPLANGTFTNFDNNDNSVVYLCSEECPPSLLPSLEHMLVDLSNDQTLQDHLKQVALAQSTKLQVLTEREVASLLTQAMPSDWSGNSLVPMPHSPLTLTWLQIFWDWLNENEVDLYFFNSQLLVPSYSSTSHSPEQFSLTRLNIEQPVVYATSNNSCSSSLLSALYKLNISVCLQSVFSFVQHEQLLEYINQLAPDSLLDLMDSHSSYKDTVFTEDEADGMRKFLAGGTDPPSSTRETVLKNLAIFSSASNSNSQLYSVNSITSQSLTNQALGEPSNCTISMSNLPLNLIILSRGDYHQLQLLQTLQVQFPSDYRLLVDYVFPLIKNKTYPDDLIDGLMCEVLDGFQLLNTREDNSNLSSSLHSLPFVKTSNGRKSPSELLDPRNANIAAMYCGEDVFPKDPYNTPQRIQLLISCGLQTSVTPQQVLDIIYSVSSPANTCPQPVSTTIFDRAKAVLEYISTPSFYSQIGGVYNLANNRQNSYSFSDALKELATSRSWLPVLNCRPSDYCGKLSWKGSNCDSHFVTLSGTVIVPSSSTSHTFPHLVGSQMYLVSPAVSPEIADMLSTDPKSIAQRVVIHFREILACKDQPSVAEVMDSLVHKVYSYMNKEGVVSVSQLYSIKEWIYIRRENKFIAPTSVALKQNPDFRRDLEPYIYILPESLSQYTALFGQGSKVMLTISQSQILSVLKMIRKDVLAGIVRVTYQEAWRTVMSILNWLTEDGTKSVSSDVDAADILVPIEAESEWPQLVQASEVVYTDNEFLKQYVHHEDSYKFVHNRISVRLAHHLGVVPLSESLEISEDVFEDTGQDEPLTTRLKNVLRDYKDGLTIIKELLQNADDAEATEVNICYDTRQHETDSRKLFLSGMSEAHGPALIVHNNKVFSDDDFINITKLAGATKQGNSLKIGKFGIGFSSVYHMTDIPSFISREYLYVFDPTLSYLKKEVKNPARPGKKTKFACNFLSRSKQLDPYIGLFGFDKAKSYQGTMFRFPFRTHPSELSGTCYTEATIKELVSAIRENSNNLLLFLQNVRKISFQQIVQGKSEPVVLFKITRETVPLRISLSSGTEIRKLSCTSSTSCHWLVSQKSDSSSQQDQRTASVACPLGSPCYKVDPKFEGEMFCFLPLSQKTGLPVHVSSNFAVINNRRGIWASDEATSQTDGEVAWNISLMKGIVARAYHALLTGLKEMSKCKLVSVYTFFHLWPKKEKLLQHNPWDYLVEELYKLIASDPLFFSTYRKQWLCLNESKVLASDIFCQPSEQSTPACVQDVLHQLNIPVVDLPVSYHQHFNLKRTVINESTFTEMFFKNLGALKSNLKSRSEVVQYMLVVYASECGNETTRDNELKKCFEEYACIPCTPDGRILRRCTQVVDPKSSFAQLFDFSEGYTPIKLLSDRQLSYFALRKLGMISETLPYKMLLERALSIANVYKCDKTKALKRIGLIVTACASIERYEHHVQLSRVPFLPVLPKPSGYHLAWKGDGCKLMCGKDLMTKWSGWYKEYVNSDLAGSQVAVVNEGPLNEGGCGILNENAISVLKIRLFPTTDEVVAHLFSLQKVFKQRRATSDQLSSIDRMCSRIYDFLDKKLKLETDGTCLSASALYDSSAVKSLKGKSCVWTGKQFVDEGVIAQKSWSIDGPYLHCLPSILSAKENLLAVLNVKEQFSLDDVKSALEKMKKEFGKQRVNEHCQNILKDIISLLQKLELDESKSNILMLPDEYYVLYPSDKLAYNDVDWEHKDPKVNYVNEIVPRHLAKKLGVQPARTKILERFANSSSFPSVEFGPHEDLTIRIQNILRDYPFDNTVLKELLQNADDAKATKVYFILDKRTHGDHSVLSENWSELQGPALLVWNDSIFSEKDLQGIQRVGLGGKRSDFESIGQYGIGFNVVYHLTDCPSFISGGETMCVLDPHCHYVPEANERYPGRRFDGLSKLGFWEKFPDMCSSYLKTGLDNCPPEIKGFRGSLFRFPLRTTESHLENSSIVLRDVQGRPVHGAITSADMFETLRSWAPRMKEAMLFLDHVTELKFMVIEEGSKQLEMMEHLRTKIGDSDLKSFAKFKKALPRFRSKQGGKPDLVTYLLTFKCIHSDLSGKEVSTEEKWLIQQGVGDMDNEQQKWNFIDSIPRHGIAAPMPHASSCSSFRGYMFCFLPLPVSTNLPVHINGHFVLNSTRRNLWSSADSGSEDNRSTWNWKLLKAIASSYAVFLERARPYFVSAEPYKTLDAVKNDIEQYYKLFPHVAALDGRCTAITKLVYAKVIEKKLKILAVVCSKQAASGSTETFREVNWYPSHVDTNLSILDQVYFWDVLPVEKETKAIIEGMGMRLTSARSALQYNLNDVLKKSNDELKFKKINPETVFDYYCEYFAQACFKCQFPCPVTDSIFKSVHVFKIFTKYLLNCFVFPKQPFGHPLLLTADNLLRRFDEAKKVLKSNYLHLFPECPEYFLHPEMAKIVCSDAYFAPGSDKACNLLLAQNMFSKQLPESLRGTRVSSLPSMLPINLFIAFWKCFTTESIFRENLPELLNDWALLPSTSGSLHSYSDTLVPVVPIDAQNSGPEAEIYYSLQEVGIPFLDADIITSSMISFLSCPTISDTKTILKAVFHLHQEKGLSDVVDGKCVKNLITYFKKINLNDDPESLTYIRSLPLFECIDGTFTAVKDKKAYFWPHDACQTGYSNWIKHHPGAVFLNYQATWKELTSPKNLEICSISAEEMYCEYIFAHFNSLSETERYDHLTHIKNTLFSRNMGHLKHSLESSIQQTARHFLEELKKASCIGEDETLKPVSYFCDHNCDIFTTFSKTFPFLPDYFKTSWDEWHKFLLELDLQCSISKSDFLGFCNEIASGKHKEPLKASNVLLNYLISDIANDAKWYEDNPFLKMVANIPFVSTCSVPELTWIVDSQNESEQQLVRLGEAATLECAVHLWTLKPIVKLPFIFPKHCKLANNLGVTYEASVSDAVENIKNICTSKELNFTDFCLFDQYPVMNEPPDDPVAKPLKAVMIDHFSLLQSKIHELENHCQVLREIPCIPVYSTYDGTPSWQVVLVRPSVVLFQDVQKEFHPYLHRLDIELKQFTPLLKEIGVETTINYEHIQKVLEMAHKYSCAGIMKQKTKVSVFAAVRILVKLLSQQITVSSSSDIDQLSKTLSPLFLPDSDEKLVFSANLLYVDDTSFKGTFHPQLKDSRHSLLKVKTSQSKLKISEKNFCELLPLKVRPEGLSSKCSQLLSGQCKKVTTQAHIGNTLKETFEIQVLPRALTACITHYFRESDSSFDFEICAIASKFFDNIDIIALECLRVDITFNQTKQLFGSIDKIWFLEINEQTLKGTLYLDSNLRRESHRFFKLVESLSHSLLQLIGTRISQLQAITPEDYIELVKILGLLLASRNPADIREVLEDYDIPIEEEIYGVTFEIGKEIPECWHHRLDQEVDNVFHPGEMVGHEVMDDHIVSAKVLHPVLPKGVESFDQVAPVSRKYIISTHLQDEDPKEVNSVRLYKFLHGLNSLELGSKSASTLLQQKLRRQNHSEICSHLKRQLDEICKLPTEDRKKAINRLCLKWHPDKNHGAEDVFRFLCSEISERNLSNDILSEDLERTASRHKKFYDREQSSSKSQEEEVGNSSSTETSSFSKKIVCPEKSPDQGRQWVRQAEAHFKSLLLLREGAKNDPEVSGDVCFLAHQVAEKALKGGKYFVCGLDANSLHSPNISTHAYGLQAERPRETHGLVAHTLPLENYYHHPRYPDRWPTGVVPADQYTYEQAESAKNHAQAILDVVKSLMKE